MVFTKVRIFAKIGAMSKITFSYFMLVMKILHVDIPQLTGLIL